MDFFSGGGVSLLLLLIPAAPLVMLMTLAWPEWREKLVKVAPWSALPALILGYILPSGTQLDLPGTWWHAGLILDDTGRFFLVVNALLWLLSGIFATAWFKGNPGGHSFMAFYLAAMAGHLGLTLALDIPTFYLCFALMGFSTYGLVVHDGTWSSRRAGRLYLFMLMIGELGLFGGVAMAATQSTSMMLPGLGGSWIPGFGAVFLFAVGFGIKAGMLGGHGWLPLAHPAAPVPASAVLSAVMIKAGLFGWLRLTPLEGGWTAAWSEPFFFGLLILGGVAAVYGAVVGLWQKSPKTILAYSSVSQMGWLTMLLSAYLAYPGMGGLGQGALLLFVLHHALAKGSLFLGVGIMQRSMGMSRRLAWWLLLLPGAALAGVPATSGILAKYALGAVVGFQEGVTFLAPMLFLATLGTTLLMARFLLVAANHGPDANAGVSNNLGMWLPWLLLLGLSVTLPWFWLLQAFPDEAAAWIGAVWTTFVLFKSLWPLLLGGVLVVMVLRMPWPQPLTFWTALVTGLRIRRRQRERRVYRWWRRQEAAALLFERRLQQWPTAGRALILLAVVLGVSLWFAV